MLSQDEKQKIEEEIKKFPKKSAACIEALKIVQEKKTWVSDESIRDVAEILDMTPSEVDSVATFYNLIFRHPVGRHVILFCDSISCWVLENEPLLGYLNQKLGIQLGETTPDERFTLLPIACLGNCDHAPTIMIDNDLYNDVTSDKLDGILKKYE